MGLIGVIGFAVLAVLPGAWVTFGLALPGVGFAVRLACGVILSPVVLLAQYYVATALGASFRLTAILLVLINLPAAALLVPGCRGWRPPSARTVLAVAAALAVPLALVFLRLHDEYIRAYNGHAWLHGEIIGSLVDGGLHPEEPQLAGLRLGYPWGGHVYQALLSFVLGPAPVSSFAWTNVIWLLCIFGVVAATVAELGGGLVARAMSIPLLAFAVNCVGSTLRELLPRPLVERYDIWGASRYSPWIRKFYGFDQMAISFGLFAALVYFTVRPRPLGRSHGDILMAGLLLGGLGVIYPILFPAGCAVLGARLIAWLVTRLRARGDAAWPEAIGLGVALLASAALTFAHLRFVTADRVTSGVVILDGFWNMRLKVASSVISLLPLWAGLLLAARWLWRERREALVTLTLATAGSVFLYVVFWIPNARNEYKYIMSAAILLTPIASLAVERLAARLGRGAVPALAALTLLMAAPAVHGELSRWPPLEPGLPALDASGFQLRLADHPWAALLDAIHDGTPRNAIVVAAATPVSLPTLTGRSLYAPLEDTLFVGVGLGPDYLLTAVKGYDARVLEARRADLRALYGGADAEAREDALERIRAAGRPVVIIVADGEGASLADWLEDGHIGSMLYSGDGLRAWLVQPGEAGRRRS